MFSSWILSASFFFSILILISTVKDFYLHCHQFTREIKIYLKFTFWCLGDINPALLSLWGHHIIESYFGLFTRCPLQRGKMNLKKKRKKKGSTYLMFWIPVSVTVILPVYVFWVVITVHFNGLSYHLFIVWKWLAY